MDDSTKVNHLEVSDEEHHPDDGEHRVVESPESMSTVSCFSSSSSSCSTLPPHEQFKPRFSVKLLSNSVTKDGAVVLYTIKARWLTAVPESNKQEATVNRQFEDFEYLHHCLVTSAFPGHGLIIPPIPPEPPARPSMAEEKSRERLGADTRTLISDEWHKDCWHLQQYLKLMLNHPLYGKHEIWERFLTSKDPPARVKIKKPFKFISRISDSINSHQASHKDLDEFFQQERDWVNNYSYQLKECSDAFNAILSARLKLCGVLAHLSTALNLNLVENESSISRKGMKFSNMFSVAVDNYRKGLELMNYNDEASLGSCLELWTRYIESEKEMLLGRTLLMVDYETANRSLDRAKASNREKAHTNKIEVERVFEECSDVARTEIKRFQMERSRSLGDGIEKYSRAQLLLNRDIFKLLTNSVQNLKRFQI